MKTTYHLAKKGMEKTDVTAAEVIIYKQATSEERQQFLKEYTLPDDVFDFYDTPTVVPRIEYLNSKKMGNTMIFVLANIVEPESQTSAEERLESHTFILGEKQLFWFINEDTSHLDEELFAKNQADIQSLESILMYTGLLSYKHFTEELREQKRTIDALNNQADHKTSNQVLIDVANTERDMVMLEHTLDTQEQAFSHLLENETFLSKLNDQNILHDIKWYNRQVNKLVHVYRDLLDTVSSLFSDIMNNNLNKIMKFLSSVSLVLASASLIASLWGMNTGGLPGEENDYGTLIMVGVAFIAGLSMYLFLNKKNYMDD